jgi:hypothetical protein
LQSRLRDAGIVVLAGLSFGVVGSIGAATMQHFSTPHMWIGDQFALLYWLRWGARLFGRLYGDFLCGALLGWGLRILNPWLVYTAIVALVIGILVANGAFLGADDGRWVASVGLGWAIFQFALQGLSIFAVVAMGIMYGRRGQARRNRTGL